MGLRGVDDVLRLYTGNRDEVAAYVGDGPILSDGRPLIESYRSTEEMTDVASMGRIRRDVAHAFHSRPPVVEVRAAR